MIIRFSQILTFGFLFVFVVAKMSTIKIDLVSSDEESEDSDFEASEGASPKPRLRQSILNEYSRKRGVDEDLFEGTFLAEFSLRAASWPDYRIHFDVGRPYNFLNLRLGDVPLQVWQASVHDISDEETKFARLLDLRGGVRQRTSKDLREESDKLLALGWSKTGTIKERLDTTGAGSASKRSKMLHFLQETFACLAAIASVCTTADADSATVVRPSVLVLACEQGLERSLILFNLLAYAVALKEEAIHGDHGALEQVCKEVSSHFVLRHERLESTPGESSTILNESVHSTLENLPAHVCFFLTKARLAERKEKRQRYETRGCRLYY